MVSKFPLILILIASCQTSKQSNQVPHESLELNYINITLPKIISDKSTVQPKTYLLQNQFLDIYEIVRRRAELRQGPGVRFPLVDQILPKKTVVFKFDSYKNWIKILDPHRDLAAWIHNKALQKLKYDNLQPFNLPVKTFPKVFATKKITHAFTYKDQIKLPVLIPKGTPFHYLKRDKKNYLVIITRTNSLIWLTRGDVL